MLEVILALWNIVLDSLDNLWNMVFSLSDRQIAILMVVGTFAVAVVAAFQDRIRSRLFAPRLRLEEHRDYRPDEGPVPILDPKGNIICKGCFVGLPIRNDGPAPAQAVEVVISELERFQNNTFKLDRTFYLLPLKWRHYVPERVFLGRLLPGSVRHIGLGYIPSELTEKIVGPGFQRIGLKQDEILFVINTSMRPTTRSDLLPPGRYRLTLEISAANSRKSVKSFIELSFDGEWREDNMRDMISVRPSDHS